MGSHTAFFYGTLMSPEVLSRVCHGLSNPTFSSTQTYLRTQPAILPSHRRHRVRNADYPAIVPCSSASSSVRGTYVTGLTDGDIYRLDIFEGDEYERRSVRCRVLNHEQEGGLETEAESVEGAEVETQTYIWVAGRERLEDAEWDFEAFRREKMRFWVGREAADRDEGLRDVDALGIDGTGGRGVKGHISDELRREQEKAEQMQDGKGELLMSAV